jgi:hypothetical protein
MGDDKDKTKQTTGSMPRGSSQVGTHGQTGSEQGSQTGKNEYQGQGSQGKGQGQDRGRGLNKEGAFGGGQDSWKQGDPTTPSEGAWNDRAQRDMQQGDETRPAQPGGTSPLDKDQQPVNQNRPVQQNR